ncbi:MAG: hypothetical protein H7099_08790 [Gemmatimonadaceae bacterium]|nr:hypothetical protein [Gemmatimonadaceae bacterium]
MRLRIAVEVGMRRTLIDAETLAAFIDGTMPAAERERVAAVLASDAEQYRIFTDATRITSLARMEDTRVADTGDGDTHAANFPTLGSPSRRRAALRIGSMLAAAAIVGVVALSRGAAPADTLAVIRQIRIADASGAGAMDRALGAGWGEGDHPIVRGDGADSDMFVAPSRLGALVAALTIAGTLADSTAWTHTTSVLASTLSGVSGAAPLAAQLERDDMRAAATRDARARQVRQLSGDTAAFDAGAWVEGARLSLRAGRTENLRSDAPLRIALPSVIESLESHRDATAWRDALRGLRAMNVSRDTTAATLDRLVREVVSALPTAGDARVR